MECVVHPAPGEAVCGVVISGTAHVVVVWPGGDFGFWQSVLLLFAACSQNWGCSHLLGVSTCCNKSLKVSSQTCYQQNVISPVIWAEDTRNGLMFP